MKVINTYYNPLGRIFKLELETSDIIECTEMRTVAEEFLDLKMPEIYKHITPFEKVWILDLSTQIGCPQKCIFCDIPVKTKFKRNLTADEMFEQFKFLIENTDYVKSCKKLRVYFARMGEPLYNVENILSAISKIKGYISSSKKDFNATYHVSTMMPSQTFEGESNESALLKLLNEDVEVTISMTTLNEKDRDKYYVSNYASVKQILDIIEKKPKETVIKLSLISIKGAKYSYDVLRRLSAIPKLTVRVTNCCANVNTIDNGLEDNNLSELEIFKSIGIDTETLFVPYYKNYGLSCGQFL